MSLVFSQEEVDKIRDNNSKKLGEAQSLVRIIDNMVFQNNMRLSDACKLAGSSESEYNAAKELINEKAAS